MAAICHQGEGSMSNCRDSVAIVKSRAYNGMLKAHRDWISSRRDADPADLVEEFIEFNQRWLNPEAEEKLRSLDEPALWRVVEKGTMQGVRDPVAIIIMRARPDKKGDRKGGKKGSGKGSGKGGAIVPIPAARNERGGKGRSGKGHEEERCGLFGCCMLL